MNAEIKVLRDKMIAAVKAINAMQEADNFFGGNPDKKSQDLIKSAQDFASDRITKVGIQLDKLANLKPKK